MQVPEYKWMQRTQTRLAQAFALDLDAEFHRTGSVGRSLNWHVGTVSVLLLCFDLLHRAQTTTQTRPAAFHLLEEMAIAACEALPKNADSRRGKVQLDCEGHSLHLTLARDGVVEGVGRLWELLPDLRQCWESNVGKAWLGDSSGTMRIAKDPSDGSLLD